MSDSSNRSSDDANDCVRLPQSLLVHQEQDSTQSHHHRRIPCLLLLPWGGMLPVMTCALYSAETFGFPVDQDSSEELQGSVPQSVTQLLRTYSQFLKLVKSTQLTTAVTFYIGQNFIPWYVFDVTCIPVE